MPNRSLSETEYWQADQPTNCSRAFADFRLLLLSELYDKNSKEKKKKKKKQVIPEIRIFGSFPPSGLTSLAPPVLYLALRA